MTQRDRSTPDASLPAPLSPVVFAASAGSSFWEEWYAEATPEQRDQVLQLARQQGVLCTSQLPANEMPTRLPLAGILAGSARLEPIVVADLDPVDTALDPQQRLAVARALATPDLALVQGYSGSGKTRVVAEVLRQADRQGLRVLFVAASAAGVDLALERVAGESSLRVLRWLGTDEVAERLPSQVARLTVSGRVRLYDEQTLPAARRAVEEAKTAVSTRDTESQVWVSLAQLLEAQTKLQAELATLGALPSDEQQSATIEQNPEWRTAAARFNEELQKVDQNAAEVTRELERLTNERKVSEDELHNLAPLVEARGAGQWWTMAYWRSFVQGNAQPRVEELRNRCKQSTELLEGVQHRVDEFNRQRQDIASRRQAERSKFAEAERARLSADRDAALAKRQDEVDSLKAQWQEACARLSPSTPHPEATAESLNAARTTWQSKLPHDEQEITRREQWLDALEKTRPALAAHLISSARIVAAPISSLPAEATGFDLVLVEEADRLNESELLAIARRARRCVLVGEPPLDLIPPTNRRPNSRDRAVPRPPFARLWRLFHPDPRRLESHWFVAGNRLVARLRSVGPDGERWIGREPVFDRPEIEIGIISPPRQEPKVVEVSFPATISPQDARTFLIGELDEVCIQTRGLGMTWQQNQGRVTLTFESTTPSLTVSLAEGISEHLVRHQDGYLTVGLEFDAANWDLESARAWVEQRLHLRDVNRTTILSKSYRAGPGVMRFLSEALHGGIFREGSSADLVDGRPPVELVPVPWGDSRHETRRVVTATPTSRLRVSRGGAGVEIELADLPPGPGRRGDLLPAELRQQLPGRGLVNFIEARAVIAALEDMISDPAFQSASDAWQRLVVESGRPAANGGQCGTHGPTGCPSVAVLSVFPAQVALLRLLAARSTVLSKSHVPVEIGTPVELAQRESLVVFLSLTRSHTHRAVPYSDNPESLLWALTRAAGRLVFFGDVGTLVRRGQWHGALDHLDDVAGSLEQALVGQLVAAFTDPEPRDRNRDEQRASGRTRESTGV